MRALRIIVAPLRLLGLLLLIVGGLLIAAVVFPRQAPAERNAVMRRWSRLLLAVCGTRLRVAGVPLEPQFAGTGLRAAGPGSLLLLNHISWLDVFALDAALPCRFVAKSEIGRWPLLGPLVSLSGTLYIERGRRHAVHATNQRVRERLAAGEMVAVFPEGTTTDGRELLPFHANLIAPALEVQAPVWPVALRYTEDGRPSAAAAFIGDMGLVTSLWNVLVARRLQAELVFLPPLTAQPPGGAPPTRHQLAQAARAAIAAELGLAAAPPNPALPPADTAAEPASGPASAAR